MSKHSVSQELLPGSKEATKRGCRCPVIDNHYGKGWMGGIHDSNGMTIYAINELCPLHGMGTNYWNDGRDVK